MPQNERTSKPASAKDSLVTLKILTWVFGLLGLTMLAAALIIFLIGIFSGSDTVQAEGTVVDLRTRFGNSNSNNPKAPVIDYMVEGKKYVYNSEIYSSLSPYKIGDKVIVHYKPTNPQDAQLDFGVGQLLSVIFGLIGAVFILVSGVLWFIRARIVQKRKNSV